MVVMKYNIDNAVITGSDGNVGNDLNAIFILCWIILMFVLSTSSVGVQFFPFSIDYRLIQLQTILKLDVTIHVGYSW